MRRRLRRQAAYAALEIALLACVAACVFVGEELPYRIICAASIPLAAAAACGAWNRWIVAVRRLARIRRAVRPYVSMEDL